MFFFEMSFIFSSLFYGSVSGQWKICVEDKGLQNNVAQMQLCCCSNVEFLLSQVVQDENADFHIAKQYAYPY